MTRRGPWIDKDLLPAAREECVEALQNTSEVVGEGVIKMVRGDRQKVCEIYGEEFIATRYEKTARNFLAGVHLVCALAWLK